MCRGHHAFAYKGRRAFEAKRKTPDHLIKRFGALIIVLELGDKLPIQKTRKFCSFSAELTGRTNFKLLCQFH